MRTYSNRDFATLEEHNYTLRDVVEAMGYDYGLQDYPIFDEGYRKKLNRAILDHFRFREIASDTPARFVFFLNRKMREQMPNVNPIYAKVREEQFDPFATSMTWGSGSNTGNTATKQESDTAATGSGTSGSRNITSDTPQVFLDNPDGEQYLTGVAKTEGTSTTESDTKASIDTTGTSASAYDSFDKSISGGLAAASYDMMAAGFMATDTIVFGLLEPLFMQVWDDRPE